jgi:hypothetical protein
VQWGASDLCSIAIIRFPFSRQRGDASAKRHPGRLADFRNPLMAEYLDVTNWARRDLFEFFRGYDNPYFNVCTQLDVR